METRLIEQQTNGYIMLMRLAGILVKLLFAFFYSLGLSQQLLPLADLPSLDVFYSFLSFCFLLILAMLTWGKLNLLASGAMLIIISAAGLLFNNYSREAIRKSSIEVINFLEWSNNWLWGLRIENESNPVLLAIVIMFFICLITYFLIARFSHPLIPAAALIIALIAAGNPLRNGNFIWFLLCTISVMGSLAGKQRKTWHFIGRRKQMARTSYMLQSLPVSLSVIIVAALITANIAPGAFYSPGVVKYVDDTLGTIVSSLGTQENFASFSLADSGYYPLPDRLGGPVTLTNEPVMKIDGYPSSMLLRGSILQTYDGTRWHRSRENSIYLFDAPVHLDEQAEVFNLDLPGKNLVQEIEEQLQLNIRYEITPVTKRMQTVFIEGRPLDIQMDDGGKNQFFFNSSGQILSRYWLGTEDTIIISSRKILSGSRGFPVFVRQVEENLVADDEDSAIYGLSQWLQLPDREEYHESGSLKLLVDELVSDKISSLGKAMAIRDFLYHHAKYELDVAVPPAEVDFISWFLDTKEGYCVYFASAMTMMCRLAGIPARYVEGYYVPPASGESSERIVTANYAHAWTEIYLAGIGWIPVDATPGGVAIEQDPGATPTPAPQVTGEPKITESPSDGRKSDLPEPGPSDESGSKEAKNSSWVWLWPLLLVILAIAGYIWYSSLVLRRAHDRKFVNGKYQDKSELGLFYWLQIQILFKQLGFSFRNYDTPRSWLRRIYMTSGWLAGRPELVESMSCAAEKMYYSTSFPSAEDLDSLATAYDILETTAKQNIVLPKYILQRIVPFIWQWKQPLSR